VNKLISFFFKSLAFLITGGACFLVGYVYRAIKGGFEFAGFSIPDWTAFLIYIPVFIVVIACFVMGAKFAKDNPKD
jgi:hypothetical protein